MRKNSIKNVRINSEVQRALSELIRMGVKDPRVSSLTSVTDVEVAPDLKTAKVFVSVLGDEKKQKDTLEGLKSAMPYLRSQLAKSINLRNTPELRFHLDTSIEYGMHMSALINQVKAKDKAEDSEEDND
ncbi:ribosome-binding factor A [Catonella morbi ATCC 51271]|jgi:ribosome-binding factor A|uniref:Ribosome-binding factor A n=1 Tax=Catonella morbi ATCC 51271 TaxID=592026 RepID=V2Y9E9_9FIRM|nr:30S ribosome-binding factor RbfA [Catonella morbi]ESL04732.1 ribosome-binding factor A [Catonella morbi ATCC 51271]